MAAALSRLNEWTRQPPAQMWADASRVLPPWVALVLVALIGWQLAKAAWLLAPAPDVDTLPPVQATPRAAATQPAGTVSIERIVGAHLFGRVTETQAPVLEAQEDAPDTQLSLELRGTIAATEENRALAIIAERGGAERIYFIGDAVPGGATLHAVQLDRVLLRRAGRLEALRLPRSEDGAGARRTAAAPRPMPVPTREAVGLPPATHRAATVQEVVQQGGLALTEIIRPQPVFRDGRQQGYRVYPGRQRQQFTQLGLRPGDLITQINGMALDDPARGMEIFRGLADATSVTVTLDRNGETEMLTLDTAALQRGLQASDNENPTE